MKKACIVLGWFLLLVAMPLLAADSVTVIMTDGYIVQGEYAKESDTIIDSSGRPVNVAKMNGFDVIMDGPKFVILSTHSKKGGKIDKEIVRNTGTTYTTKLKTNFRKPIRAIKTVAKISDYNENWYRTLDTITIEGNHNQRITQQITKLSPYMLIIDSPTDQLSQGFHTFEEDPKLIRKLLSLHPDLREETGKPDAIKRVQIAQFLNQVCRNDGSRRSLVWLQHARQELEKAKKEIPGAWEVKATELYDKTFDELDQTETKLIANELDAAVKSGRYAFAKQYLDAYTPKGGDPADRTLLANLKANVEEVQPRYEKTLQLLRRVVEKLSGMETLQTQAAVVGVAPAIFAPRPKLDANETILVSAASTILSELHPDTASRLELFYELAKQAETRAQAGKTTEDQPANLLAYAVSGWTKGKNGADRQIDAAVRNWQLRQLAVEYLRLPLGNDRRALLDAYLAAHPQPVAPDELTQIITLIPPPFAEPSNEQPGIPVDAKACLGVENIRRLNTGPQNELGKGIDYLYRLPPEYHHGRSYPLLIALPSRNFPGEHVLANLAEQAEKQGYILVAPEWVNPFSTSIYDYSGKDHPYVLAVLRDVLNRFQADPDRVFLFGYGEGADFALDVGMSYPDRFAGMSGMGLNPPPELFLEFWRNAQKLPAYFVSGELSGAFPNLRKLYERWMPRGFPALLTIYRGRGLEWYSAEVPRLFDWMGRKTRARGTAVLRLNNFAIEPWQILREGNDRYYWVGVSAGGVRPSNQVANGLKKTVQPLPQFTADISKSGTITISQALGIRRFTIWLERDLIDWTKPIRVIVNGSAPIGFKSSVLTPDLNVMLEELYRTADKKMLYLGKIEVQGPG